MFCTSLRGGWTGGTGYGDKGGGKRGKRGRGAGGEGVGSGGERGGKVLQISQRSETSVLKS